VSGGKAVQNFQSDLRNSAHRRLKQHITKAIHQSTQASQFSTSNIQNFNSFDSIAIGYGKQFFQNETFADRII
jgi:L-asparaginase/Glu-tRNA(Gln) amidotransferase subunit D